MAAKAHRSKFHNVSMWNFPDSISETADVKNDERGGCNSSSSDKSSDLFDSALNESNSAPPAPLNPRSMSYKRRFHPPRNLATPHQDVQSENQILHQDCEDDSTPSQSNARSNGLLVSPKCYPAADSTKNTSGSCMNKKWGATSKTRQQARAEECEKKDLFPPRAPTVSQTKSEKIVVPRRFPKGLGMEKTKELSLEAVRCKKRKMEEKDRFALFSDDDDDEDFDQVKQNFLGNSGDEFSKPNTKSEVVEFNFLGEPVNSSSCNEEFSDTDHAYSLLHLQQKPRVEIVKNKPENLQTSKPLNDDVKSSISASTRLKNSGVVCDVVPKPAFKRTTDKAMSNKFDFSIPTSDENIVIDSDYFSQSQTPESPGAPKGSTASAEMDKEEKADSKATEVAVPCTLSINSSNSMLKKSNSQPLPLSPIRERKKLMTSNRKSPQKARYNARSWMCTSNDENCSKAPSSSSQENDSDGVSVGTSALSPRSDLHSSATGLPSNHLLPEPSSISKGALASGDCGESSLNTTVCQIKPINEKFSGLKRVSTASPGSALPSLSAEARPSLLPKVSEASEYDFEDVLSNRFEPTLLMESTDLKETVKVSRKEKELYLVIRSVKTMHESLEDGESQKFKEDIQYLLEGVHPSCSLSTRCLSVASIATKSLQLQFRMQMRAHGVLGRLSILLNDALRHQSLSLCTAALFYVMSRDRVAIDIDPYSLVLIVKLLKYSGSVGEDKALAMEAKNEVEEKRELDKAKNKIAKMLTSLDDSASKLLTMGDVKRDVTVHSLILEAIMSVTNARNWSNPFKSQLVHSGVLKHIIEAYKKCVDSVCGTHAEDDEEILKLTLKKMIRCSKVIENVTFRHNENQHTLIVEDSGSLIAFSARVFCKLVGEIKENVNMNAINYSGAGRSNYSIGKLLSSKDAKGPAGIGSSASRDEEAESATSACNDMLHDSMAESLQEGLMECLRVCLNLTNESELGSTKLGNQSGMLSSLIDCVLHIPVLLDPEKYFDVTIMSLGLMINLLEYSPLNRRQFMTAQTSEPVQNLLSQKDYSTKQPSSQNTISAVQAFVNLFVTKEMLARQIEEEEKLNETCSEESSTVASQSNDGNKSCFPKNSRSETQPTRQMAPRKVKETRSGSAQEKNELPSPTETTAKDEQGKSGKSKMSKWDDEFVDDGEGGMIWIGRNSEESSDESVNEKERRKKEVHNIIEQSLQAAGKHMESSMIAAYVALLVGCLLQGNMNNIMSVLEFVPSGNFQSMIEQLERLHKFMALTTAANTGLLNSISTQIAVLKDANQRAATLDEHF